MVVKNTRMRRRWILVAVIVIALAAWLALRSSGGESATSNARAGAARSAAPLDAGAQADATRLVDVERHELANEGAESSKQGASTDDDRLRGRGVDPSGAPVVGASVELSICEADEFSSLDPVSTRRATQSPAVTPSHANFLWLRVPDAARTHAALLTRGVLVRSFHAQGGRMAQQLRITVGTPAENDALLSALPFCL